MEIIKQSFETYLNVGTSRSTAKLKSLHGHIAKDLETMLVMNIKYNPKDMVMIKKVALMKDITQKM